MEFLQEIVTVIPNGALAENLESVEDPLRFDTKILPIGVKKGATGALPVEAVCLGVANAGGLRAPATVKRATASNTTADFRSSVMSSLSALKHRLSSSLVHIEIDGISAVF